MASPKPQPQRLRPISGARIGCASGGFARPAKNDVALFAFEKPAPCAAVFTANTIVAAPVTVAKRHLQQAQGLCCGWLVNSGNANCGTGAAGEKAAADSCFAAAASLGCRPEQVLPFSTGVIMETIDSSQLSEAAQAAVADAKPDGWTQAAKAIMTTDTVAKATSRKFELSAGKFSINGIAKGSGMIHPNMATMLAFLVTDAAASTEQLRAIIKPAVDATFNTISVDGDTSTNDAAVLAAAGGSEKLTAADETTLAEAIADACEDLAAAILHDGEGCNRFAAVEAANFGSSEQCRLVAESVACSPLIKTMLAAGDPNIGRLLMAIGKTQLAFDPHKLTITIGGQLAYAQGARVSEFTESKAVKIFSQHQVAIVIDGGKAGGSYTCRFGDLTAEYISINSSYRS